MAIFSNTPGATLPKSSAWATDFRTSTISVCVGAATRTRRHLERMGARILVDEFATRMRRRLGEYFSIVRRRADCASLVKLSASFITTTVEVSPQLKTKERKRGPLKRC